MIKVRKVNSLSIDDCKMLQKLLNEGYSILRVDRTGEGYTLIYILELK